MKQLDPSCIADGKEKWYRLSGKWFGIVSYKVEYTAILYMDIYPREIKTCVYIKIYTWLFIAANDFLFHDSIYMLFLKRQNYSAIEVCSVR